MFADRVSHLFPVIPGLEREDYPLYMDLFEQKVAKRWLKVAKPLLAETSQTKTRKTVPGRLNVLKPVAEITTFKTETLSRDGNSRVPNCHFCNMTG